jgi:hypothetical protein
MSAAKKEAKRKVKSYSKIQLLKLHGSMTQKDRMETFRLDTHTEVRIDGTTCGQNRQFFILKKFGEKIKFLNHSIWV